MKKLSALLAIAWVMGAGGLVHGQSQEDPVLELLVKKGLVTQQEADAAKAEQKEEAEKAPMTPITVQDASVRKLVFYGDGRLRFENIDQHNLTSTNTLVDRERYRLRFGADYFYSDHFKGGFELESGTTDDSANQTFGGTFTKASINVGKIYLQYQPFDELTLVAGKFSNPWYTTTDIVYSFDLNPEGGAELLDYTIPLGGGSGVINNNDPKDVKQSAGDSGGALTIGLNAVQYLYVNSNEGTSNFSTAEGINNNDVFIIGEQIPVTWKINKELTVKVAPGFTFYTGGGNTNFDTGVATNTSSAASGTATIGAGTGTSTLGVDTSSPYFATANSSVDPVFYSPREADDLAVFSAPGEVNFKVGNIPFRPYWDFELNTEGKQRIQDVYLNTGTAASQGGFATGVTAHGAAENKDLDDNIAWAAGLQVGANKKKGDWSVLGEYRQIGLGAVDQNINGTDYADSFANQQGFKLAGAYNFTDFLTATVTYYNTWNYKSGLYESLGGTGASNSAITKSTLNLISEGDSQRVQVDLGWKF
jgi:hypothetical protein